MPVRSLALSLERSVPLGMYWRSRPLVFSFDPRCHGTVGIAEIDLDPGGDGEGGVLVHLGALVPGHTSGQLGWQGTHGLGHGRIDLLGRVACRRKAQEQDVAGGTLDQGAHGGLAPCSDDQVTLPVAGHRPVLDLGGPLADHDPRGDLASALHLALGPPGRPTTAQAAGQLPTELAPALDKECLVDRLVAHPHHRIVGEVVAQAPGDLIGRPPLAEPPFDLVAAAWGRCPTWSVWAAELALSPPLPRPGPVVLTTPIGRDLPATRWRPTTKAISDGAEPFLLWPNPP